MSYLCKAGKSLSCHRKERGPICERRENVFPVTRVPNDRTRPVAVVICPRPVRSFSRIKIARIDLTRPDATGYVWSFSTLVENSGIKAFPNEEKLLKESLFTFIIFSNAKCSLQKCKQKKKILVLPHNPRQNIPQEEIWQQKEESSFTFILYLNKTNR